MIFYNIDNSPFATFDDFKRGDNDTKREFAEVFMTTARDYRQHCKRFHYMTDTVLFVSTIVTFGFLFLQVIEFIPAWIPGFYLAALSGQELWYRMPYVSRSMEKFMRSSNASPATYSDSFKGGFLIYLFLGAWALGGWFTGEWVICSLVCSFGVVFCMFRELKMFGRLVEQNQRAYLDCGNSLLKDLKEAVPA